MEDKKGEDDDEEEQKGPIGAREMQLEKESLDFPDAIMPAVIEPPRAQPQHVAPIHNNIVPMG
eukprot:m.211681 g.211681  ORF g.211681 m.211681 type:complete len:63 (-) comp18718_c0_seq1:410-598(-)